MNLYFLVRRLFVRNSLGVLIAIAAAAALSLMGACRGADPDTTESATESAVESPAVPPEADGAAAVEPVPAELPTIVARVNGHEIGRAEFERAVKSAEAQAGQVVPPQFRDQVYRSILDRLVSFHLLVQESGARQLSVEEEEVEAELARLRGNFPTEEAFTQRLIEWQTDLETLRDETRKDLLIGKVLDLEVLPALKIDETGVRAFYEQHQSEFRQPMAMRASHVLIAIGMDAGEAEKTKARSTAEDVRARARQGADFAALARQHSQDETTAPAGGELGFVEQGQTVEPFEKALFALNPGEISEVVESPFGFHVIKATERRAERTVPFDEAAGEIRMFLIEQERQALTGQFIETLKSKAEIEILM